MLGTSILSTITGHYVVGDQKAVITYWDDWRTEITLIFDTSDFEQSTFFLPGRPTKEEAVLEVRREM